MDFDRSTSNKPWLQRYEHYQAQNDLLPFWYASDWVDLPLEEGTGGSVTINIGDDFWLYDIGFSAEGARIDEPDPLFIIPQAVVPGIEWRLRLDGNLAWGSWIDGAAPHLLHSELMNQYGEGWVLERGGFVTIEWRRVVTQDPDRQQFQRAQWSLAGCKLAPKGSTRLKAGWRNQTMSDWSMEAVLSPYRYGTRVPINDTFVDPLAHVPMTIRTRDRDFILERIGWVSYTSEAGEDAFGAPYSFLGQPFGCQLTVQDIPWHSPAPQGIHCRAFNNIAAGQNPAPSRELRIPRVIAANSLIEMEIGYDQVGYQDLFDAFGDIFVYIAGHEVIGDNRPALRRGR